MLPSGVYDPEPDPGAYPEEAGTEVSWLQPAPDAMVTLDSADPAAIVATREGLRLALIASLQYLPPRQRAVLVLRDVLAVPAAEVGVMLGTTTVSVKSALQRARARLGELVLADDQITEPSAPRARALLDQYIAAFENADAAALERLLVEDAIIEATPLRTWFAGRKTCVPFLRNRLLGSPGDWRMLATSANGQRPGPVTCTGTSGLTESACSPSPARASAGSPPSGTQDWSPCSGSGRTWHKERTLNRLPAVPETWREGLVAEQAWRRVTSTLYGQLLGGHGMVSDSFSVLAGSSWV